MHAWVMSQRTRAVMGVRNDTIVNGPTHWLNSLRWHWRTSGRGQVKPHLLAYVVWYGFDLGIKVSFLRFDVRVKILPREGVRRTQIVAVLLPNGTVVTVGSFGGAAIRLHRSKVSRPSMAIFGVTPVVLCFVAR